MDIHVLQHPDEFRAYDVWIKSHPEGNLWQSLERKKYIESLGRTVKIYAAMEHGNFLGAALVMIDRTAFGLSTWEIPRGPIGEKREELLDRMIKDAQSDKCMTLYYSPLRPIQRNDPISGRLVHADVTRIINLKQSEEEILSQMKQKGRYNIKVTEKHGVTIRQSDNVDQFYKLVEQTSNRDGFISLSKKKYQAFLQNLDGSFLMLAFDGKNEAIAGLIGAIWNKKATYYYGASSYAHRASMAPYLLQWETIRFCKAKGVDSYDLLGVAPSHAPASHPWQGITSFKEKFGGELISYPPERKIVFRPVAYHLLTLKRKLLS